MANGHGGARTGAGRKPAVAVATRDIAEHTLALIQQVDADAERLMRSTRMLRAYAVAVARRLAHQTNPRSSHVSDLSNLRQEFRRALDEERRARLEETGNLRRTCERLTVRLQLAEARLNALGAPKPQAVPA